MKLLFLQSILLVSFSAFSGCLEESFFKNRFHEESYFEKREITHHLLPLLALSPAAAVYGATVGSPAAVIAGAMTTYSPIVTNDYRGGARFQKAESLLVEANIGSGPLLEKFYQDVDPAASSEHILEVTLKLDRIKAFCNHSTYSYDEIVELVRGEL